MMRYFWCCNQCGFRAAAVDLRRLGSQLNTHESKCSADPIVVFEEEQDQPDHRTHMDAESSVPQDPERRCSTLRLTWARFSLPS
jgi:hypothetical protein